MPESLRRGAARIVAVSVAVAVAITACDGDNGTGPDPHAPASALRIDPAAPMLRLGERTALTPVFTDAASQPASAPDGPLTWSSSDPGVLVVDSAGVLFAVGVGVATIQASAGALTGSTDASVLAPQPDAGANTPVTRTIDVSGGTIEATAASGIRYALRIPAHGVDDPVDITIIPIESIGEFPIQSGAAAAVALEPDGLRFVLPAELTIVRDGGARPNVGFTMSDDFRLIPARVSGDTVRITISHFSSAGAASGTDEELNALAGLPAQEPADEALQEIAAAAAAGAEVDGEVDYDRISAALRAWLNNAVIPDLDAAEGDPLDDAIIQYVNWLAAVDTWAFGILDAEKERAVTAAAAALREEIDRLNAQCAEQNDLSPIEHIRQWVARAKQTGVAAHDPSLELQSVAAEVCAQPVIIEAELPDTIDGEATLEVRAGLSIGGRAPVFDPAVAIAVSGPGALISPRDGVVDGSGRFSASVRLEPGSTGSRIDVVATYPALPLAEASRTLTAEGRIRIGLRVNDDFEATVEPGGQVDVVAFLTQGRGGMTGRFVSFELLGSGSMSSNQAVVSDGETGETETVIYTAPAENTSARVVGSFRDGSFMVTDTATITVAGCTAPLPDFEYWGTPGVFVDERPDDGGGTVTSNVVAAEPHHLSYEAQIAADESGNWISARGNLYADDYIIIEALDSYTGDLTLHMDVYVRGEFTAQDETVDISVDAGNDLANVWIDLEGRADDPASIVRDTTVSVLLDEDVARIEGGWLPIRHYANGYVRTRGGNRTGSVSVESRMDILDEATDSAGRSIPIRICSALGASY